MPPSCGRSGSTRNGEGVQSVILGLVEDEDDFSIFPIAQSKTFVGPRRKARLQVGLHSKKALDMGRWKERNRNAYTETYWNGKETIIETCFVLCFPMFFWSFLGSFNSNVVTRLGLEEPGGPTTADLMARMPSWVVSGTDWLEVPIPYIRPIFEAYVREYP